MIKKVIFGNNIDAKIFSFFNPEYIILEHDDFFTPIFQGDKNIISDIMDTVVYLFKNKWNKKLLQELNLPTKTRTIDLIGAIDQHKEIIKKKLKDVNTGESLFHNMIYKANKEVKFGKSDTPTLTIFDIKMSDIHEKLHQSTCHQVIDLNGLGPIKYIEADQICFANATYKFDKAVSTINAVVLNKFIPGSFGELKSLSTSLSLFTTEDNQDRISYIGGDSIINRINYFKNKVVTDITGKHIFKALPGYKYKGSIFIKHGKILPCFYHNLPNSIQPIGRYAEYNPDHRIENTVEKALSESLYSIWQDQKRIYCQYQDKPITIKEKQEHTKNFIIHMIDQSTSLLNKINWKINEEEKEIYFDEVLEEWVDMFKYWLSIGITWEINPLDFINKNEQKTIEVLRRKNES